MTFDLARVGFAYKEFQISLMTARTSLILYKELNLLPSMSFFGHRPNSRKACLDFRIQLDCTDSLSSIKITDRYLD